MDKSRQQNDLEKFLVKKIEQIKPYSGHIFWGCIAVIAVILVLQFWSYNNRLIREREWDTFLQATTMTTSPEDLEKYCEDISSGIVAANFRIVAGERYLERAGWGLASDKENALKDTNCAIEHFEAALKCSSDSKIGESASYGLARSYELLAAATGDDTEVEKAIAQYKKIDSNWPKSPYASFAGDRLAFLERDNAGEFFQEYSQNRDMFERLRKESRLNIEEGEIGELRPGGDFGEGFGDMFDKDDPLLQPETDENPADGGEETAPAETPPGETIQIEVDTPPLDTPPVAPELTDEETKSEDGEQNEPGA